MYVTLRLSKYHCRMQHATDILTKLRFNSVPRNVDMHFVCAHCVCGSERYEFIPAGVSYSLAGSRGQTGCSKALARFPTLKKPIFGGCPAVAVAASFLCLHLLNYLALLFLNVSHLHLSPGL